MTVRKSTLSKICDLLLSSRQCICLTGAGVSVPSGFPSYRGTGSTGPYNPIKWKEFSGSHHRRQRYWARSYLSWQRTSTSTPNQTHSILAKWEQKGLIKAVITQNVDSLHFATGITKEKVVELHGYLRNVRCMQCPWIGSRGVWQERLGELNSYFFANVPVIAGPDGDTILETDFSTFIIPTCPGCGAESCIRPCVVFFGENVPLEVSSEARALASGCDLMLVLGTTLQTFSARRLVQEAKLVGATVVVINLGETKGTPFADLSIDLPAEEVLQELDNLLEDE